MSPSSRRRSGTYHHGDLRRALIDAALEALARDRSASFTLRSLARTVGVSHNAPYAHFPDKAALLAEIARLGFAMLADRLRRAAGRASGDPSAQMIGVAAAYVGFGVEHPAHYRLMFSAPELADLRVRTGERIGAAAFSVLTDVLTDFHSARATVTRSGTAKHVRRDALTAWSLVHGLTSLLIDGRAVLEDGSSATRVRAAENLARQAAAALLPGFARKVIRPEKDDAVPRGRP